MGRLSLECCMYDYNEDRAYLHNEVKGTAESLHRLLVQHRRTCPSKQLLDDDPFHVERNIVSCPACKGNLADLRKMAPDIALNPHPRRRPWGERIGIIGLGGFGSFLAAHLARFVDVTVHDIVDRRVDAADIGVEWGTLEEAASKDVLILAVPLNSLKVVLRQLSDGVRRELLVLDVCSVKHVPIQLMREHLPHAELVGTHPLFGPESAKGGLLGHTIVLCPIVVCSAHLRHLRTFCSRDLGLNIIEIGPEEHDRQMATVQGVTHFIARAASEIGIGPSNLSTAAYRHLLEVTRLLKNDSWDLFETIQQGNPFAREMRRVFMEKLKELESRIATQ